MQGGRFDEDEFFRALAASGARVLIIGRRAMVILGIPVLTAHYDLWVHFDDVERLNAAMAELDHHPSHPPADARARGRYVLENDEHIDVVVARAASTKDGQRLTFDDAWSRRERVTFSGGVFVEVPRPEDLIQTKAWAMRVKDVADIQLLEALVRSRSES
jgi:hypothetical protein